MTLFLNVFSCNPKFSNLLLKLKDVWWYAQTVVVVICLIKLVTWFGYQLSTYRCSLVRGNWQLFGLAHFVLRVVWDQLLTG